MGNEQQGNEQQGTETVQTTATETTRTVETTAPAAGTTPAGASGDELGKVRDLVLKAHPDVVPDLIGDPLVGRAGRLDGRDQFIH